MAQGAGDYRLPRPVDDGIGPCQRALSVATGWSWSGHQTVSSPLSSILAPGCPEMGLTT